MCSPACAASRGSVKLIGQRLDQTAAALRARPDRADWKMLFYQIANRLAHLQWFRGQGVDAQLVFVNFINDSEMGGPTTREEWEAAYQVAFYTLGLATKHPLARYVVEVFPDVGFHE